MNSEDYLTTEVRQLLEEPQRWQVYTAAERFALYNNILQYYDRMRQTQNSGIQENRERKQTFFFSREIQRLDDIFLSYINMHPMDPYNSYYLYNISGHYIERKEKEMGLWLLRSMFQKFPDLELPEYPSIHYLILETIGKMEDNIDYQIDAIQKILTRYKPQDNVRINTITSNRGIWFYRLGKAHETKATKLLYIDQEMANQELATAMDAYKQFVRSDTAIPEEQNARNLVVNKISIYNARRPWYTDPDLNNLIQKIKYAIQNNNVRAVLYYQANNFFVLSSDYRDEISLNGTNIYLPYFLGGIIQFGNLTPESNDEEAWLYSTNWPFHLTTWYLYFHKIHYPADPEIDGNWEWAGIYLGDFY